MKLSDYTPKVMPLGRDAQRLLIDLEYNVIEDLIKLRALCDKFPTGGNHKKQDIIRELPAVGISIATFYRRREKYEAFRTLSSLHVKPKVGNRKSRLSNVVTELMDAEITRLVDDKVISPKAIYDDIEGAFFEAGLRVPSLSTVKRRCRLIDDRKQMEMALGKRKAEKFFGSRSGSTPKQTIPGMRYQIDHTLVNMVCVNRLDGTPVGCPWITMAIDEASKAIVGLMLGYEVPSSASLAKFMSHMVHSKEALLEELNIDCAWPMQGLPMSIYTDNGSDFTAKAFKSGALEHNIDLEYRPVGKAHYGGIIERLIGTTMGRVKLMPGSTDSAWKEYKRAMEVSAEAVYTLEELEYELVFWAAGVYNNTQREDLNFRTPLEVWCSGIGGLPLALPAHKSRFFLDFLPRGYRRLNRGYVEALGLTYWDDALESLLRMNTAKRYEIRFDIHDITRIWLRNPKTGRFIRMRTRRRDLGPTSLAEWRSSRRQARAMGLDPRCEADRIRALAAIRRHKMAVPAKQAQRIAARQDSRNHISQKNSDRHGIGRSKPPTKLVGFTGSPLPSGAANNEADAEVPEVVQWD